jgi:hypothetical protein
MEPVGFRECELPCMRCVYYTETEDPYLEYCRLHEYVFRIGEAGVYRCDDFYKYEPEG